MGNRINIKAAAAGLYHHSFDVSSITSLDFGELVPTRVFECLPKDDISKFAAATKLHIAPQDFPPFGKAYYKTAAFFVPEHQLIESSEAFHANMNMYKGKSVHLPYFLSTSLVEMFAGSTDLCTSVGTSSDPTVVSSLPVYDSYDFCYVTDNSGAPLYTYYQLTTAGVRLFKIFKMLGYDFPSFAAGSVYSSVYSTGQYKLNALPFLAYLKVFTDYFLNGSFYNGNAVVALLHSIHDGEDYISGGNTWYDSTSGNITTAGLYVIYNNIFLPFQKDMYLNAFNSPNDPLGVTPGNSMLSINPSGPLSPRSFVDNNGVVREVNDASTIGQYMKHSNNSDLSYLSAVGIRLLTAFDKFVRLRNLVGSKAVQRIYAMFGIRTDDFNSHFVHKIFEGQTRIQFSTVVSNSDTENSSSQYPGKSLGAYAGYGQAAMEYNFTHKCNDFGYIIVVSWIAIVPIILRGIHPQNLRLNPFDFWTPQYDGQTVRAIPQAEISVNKTGNDDPTTVGNGDMKIFGFTNLYDDYRNQRDSVAGDFIHSFAKHFMFARDFSIFRAFQRNQTFNAQNIDVQYYYPYGKDESLTDPFQYDSTVGDRFYLYVDFSIDANRPVLSDALSLDLDGPGDTEVSRNGTMID